MHMRALVGLVVALLGLSGCERRNLDQCRVPDLPCEDGRFCKIPTGATVGKCEPTECSDSRDCASDRPNCSPQGRCFACSSVSDCAKQTGAPICDTGRCVECKTSKDCSDKSRPYCEDPSRACRACKRHAECDSTAGARDGVCVKDDTLRNLPTGQALQNGMCVPSDRIVSVDINSCSGTCTVQDKLTEVAAQKPYLRIGQFTSAALITVRPVPGLPEVHIISPLGDYAPPDPAAKDKIPNAILTNSNGTALRIEGGASVTVEGLLIKDSKLGLACVSGAAPTRVRILRSLIGASDVGIQSTAGCELSIEQSWIGEGPRDRYQGLVNSGNILAMDLRGTKFDIINTVFNHNSPAPGMFGGIWINDATASTPGRIINSTFTRHETADMNRKALLLDCIPATTSIAIVNSLFLNSTALTGGTTYIHSACRGPDQKYLGTDDTALTGDNNATDLVLADVFTSPTAQGDLTLKSTADARVRDGGLTQFVDGTGKSLLPTIDIIGAARQATKISRGAFEPTR